MLNVELVIEELLEATETSEARRQIIVAGVQSNLIDEISADQYGEKYSVAWRSGVSWAILIGNPDDSCDSVVGPYDSETAAMAATSVFRQVLPNCQFVVLDLEAPESKFPPLSGEARERTWLS